MINTFKIEVIFYLIKKEIKLLSHQQISKNIVCITHRMYKVAILQTEISF